MSEKAVQSDREDLWADAMQAGKPSWLVKSAAARCTRSGPAAGRIAPPGREKHLLEQLVAAGMVIRVR
jgi:hypothetical protein